MNLGLGVIFFHPPNSGLLQHPQIIRSPLQGGERGLIKVQKHVDFKILSSEDSFNNNLGHYSTSNIIVRHVLLFLMFCLKKPILSFPPKVSIEEKHKSLQAALIYRFRKDLI